MGNGKQGAEENKELRAKAEAKLKKQIDKIHKESKGDFKKVLHELEVHQIELEMQYSAIQEYHHYPSGV